MNGEPAQRFVGADAPVRPAVCTCERGRTDANPYNVCRGRCPHRPAGGTTVFTIRRNKFAIAQRADRDIRPYRALCGVAENARNFVVAPRRVDVGIDPYGDFTLSPFVVQYWWCTVRGRGRTPPLRHVGQYCVFTIRCGKFAIALRADRVVRPYGCVPFRIGTAKISSPRTSAAMGVSHRRVDFYIL